MKRLLPWVIAIGALGVVAAFLFSPQRQPGTMGGMAGQPAAPVTLSPAAPATATAAPAGEGKIVYTFTDEAKMREFATMMQQRQGLALRMAVSQDYWNAEQTAMAELDKKLTSDYQLDTTKNYFLDADRKVLLERELPAASPAGAPADQATVQPLPPGEEKIAYTFTDDAKLNEFATIMQQRQGVALRMAVLQDYWNQDKTAMDQLDKQLTDAYQLDLTKNYSLDTNRRVLIELPPAPAPAEAVPAAPTP